MKYPLSEKYNSEKLMKKIMGPNPLKLQEEMLTMPFGEIWEAYCRECGKPADGEWFEKVKQYEQEVLANRK